MKMPCVFVSRMRSVRREARYDCLIVGPMWDVLYFLRCGSLSERRMIVNGVTVGCTLTVYLNGRSEMWILLFKNR